MSDVRLLIVDDALFCRDFVAFLVMDEPRIDSSCGVGTAAEAMEIIETRDFDVVTLDLGLPDAIGLDLIESFLRADIAVVVISGDARQKSAAMAKGAAAFFDKSDLLANKELFVRTIFSAASPSAKMVGRMMGGRCG